MSEKDELNELVSTVNQDAIADVAHFKVQSEYEGRIDRSPKLEDSTQLSLVVEINPKFAMEILWSRNLFQEVLEFITKKQKLDITGCLINRRTKSLRVYFSDEATLKVAMGKICSCKMDKFLLTASLSTTETLFQILQNTVARQKSKDPRLYRSTGLYSLKSYARTKLSPLIGMTYEEQIRWKQSVAKYFAECFKVEFCGTLSLRNNERFVSLWSDSDLNSLRDEKNRFFRNIFQDFELDSIRFINGPSPSEFVLSTGLNAETAKFEQGIVVENEGKSFNRATKSSLFLPLSLVPYADNRIVQIGMKLVAFATEFESENKVKYFFALQRDYSGRINVDIREFALNDGTRSRENVELIFKEMKSKLIDLLANVNDDLGVSWIQLRSFLTNDEPRRDSFLSSFTKITKNYSVLIWSRDLSKFCARNVFIDAIRELGNLGKDSVLVLLKHLTPSSYPTEFSNRCNLTFECLLALSKICKKIVLTKQHYDYYTMIKSENIISVDGQSRDASKNMRHTINFITKVFKKDEITVFHEYKEEGENYDALIHCQNVKKVIYLASDSQLMSKCCESAKYSSFDCLFVPTRIIPINLTRDNPESNYLILFERKSFANIRNIGSNFVDSGEYEWLSLVEEFEKNEVAKYEKQNTFKNDIDYSLRKDDQDVKIFLQNSHWKAEGYVQEVSGCKKRPNESYENDEPDLKSARMKYRANLINNTPPSSDSTYPSYKKMVTNSDYKQEPAVSEEQDKRKDNYYESDKRASGPERLIYRQGCSQNPCDSRNDRDSTNSDDYFGPSIKSYPNFVVYDDFIQEQEVSDNRETRCTYKQKNEAQKDNSLNNSKSSLWNTSNLDDDFGESIKSYPNVVIYDDFIQEQEVSENRETLCTVKKKNVSQEGSCLNNSKKSLCNSSNSDEYFGESIKSYPNVVIYDDFIQEHKVSDNKNQHRAYKHENEGLKNSLYKSSNSDDDFGESIKSYPNVVIYDDFIQETELSKNKENKSQKDSSLNNTEKGRCDFSNSDDYFGESIKSYPNVVIYDDFIQEYEVSENKNKHCSYKQENEAIKNSKLNSKGSSCNSSNSDDDFGESIKSYPNVVIYDDYDEREDDSPNNSKKSLRSSPNSNNYFGKSIKSYPNVVIYDDFIQEQEVLKNTDALCTTKQENAARKDSRLDNSQKSLRDSPNSDDDFGESIKSYPNVVIYDDFIIEQDVSENRDTHCTNKQENVAQKDSCLNNSDTSLCNFANSDDYFGESIKSYPNVVIYDDFIQEVSENKNQHCAIACKEENETFENSILYSKKSSCNSSNSDDDFGESIKSYPNVVIYDDFFQENEEQGRNSPINQKKSDRNNQCNKLHLEDIILPSAMNFQQRLEKNNEFECSPVEKTKSIEKSTGIPKYKDMILPSASHYRPEIRKEINLHREFIKKRNKSNTNNLRNNQKNYSRKRMINWRKYKLRLKERKKAAQKAEKNSES